MTAKPETVCPETAGILILSFVTGLNASIVTSQKWSGTLSGLERKCQEAEP
jgi:hypothetical protein